MTAGDADRGPIALLFTDVEGSTKLLHALGDEPYAAALAEHRRVVRDAFGRHGGAEVDTQGDAFFFVFPDAASGLGAAAEARDALEAGPIRLRMGVHAGRPIRTAEGYVGVDVHRAARIAAAGHGGQILVSAEAVAQAGDVSGLLDLGEHRLKDLAAPERIFQLGAEPFPPLKSLSPSNLPVPTTPFLGREAELAELGSRLADPAVRVVTVLGTGGIGKTRLALQSAAEASETFVDGLWWVALAPLTDVSQVAPALAGALGVREQEGVGVEEALAARLEGRRALVLLDNAEHLLPALADAIVRLLAASDRLIVLVTSRERLQLSAETVLSVPELTADDAATFLLERAAARGLPVERTPDLDTLCARLDRLPLALELASARLRTFGVEQLLERLGERLDLLKGDRDLEPRQRTLRATLEWSHDLLSPDERTVFRRFAVFVDGATLEAVEEVGETDVDDLESVADQSLLQRRSDAAGPRWWMLESIRELAAERLDAAGERAALRARHLAHYLALARRMSDALRAGEPEEGPVATLEAEIGNLRAAVAFAEEIGDGDAIRAITAALPAYWDLRGRYAEGRAWVERALAIASAEDDTRRRLLSARARLAYAQGDHVVAVEASDEAAALAARLGGATERLELLGEQAYAALLRDDLSTAEALYRERLGIAVAADNGVSTSSCRLNLAYVANRTGRHDEADALLAENLPFVRSRGQARCEAHTLAGMAETAVYRGRAEERADEALLAATRGLQIHDPPTAAYCLDLVAASAAASGDGGTAAVLLAATEAARQEMGVEADDDERRPRESALALIDDEDLARWDEGRALALPDALALATREAARRERA
jgi:predicted ATPase/class 3 adenylate cyclase